jgi:hypothetical protein
MNLRQKVLLYERVLHQLQMHREVTMDSCRVKAILDAIGDWSYAHRQGNGELTERQQRKLIHEALQKLEQAIT